MGVDYFKDVSFDGGEDEDDEGRQVDSKDACYEDFFDPPLEDIGKNEEEGRHTKSVRFDDKEEEEEDEESEAEEGWDDEGLRFDNEHGEEQDDDDGEDDDVGDEKMIGDNDDDDDDDDGGDQILNLSKYDKKQLLVSCFKLKGKVIEMMY